jgi:hypothetical protein
MLDRGWVTALLVSNIGPSRSRYRNPQVLRITQSSGASLKDGAAEYLSIYLIAIDDWFEEVTGSNS